MVDVGGDREEILYILNSIVTEYGRAKVKVGNEVLLLRYIWNDVDRVRLHMPIFPFLINTRRQRTHLYLCSFFRMALIQSTRKRWGNY